MKYVELFAGVGGFRLGIERAFNNCPEQQARNTLLPNGHDHSDKLERKPVPICVFANEWDKYAAQTYNKNFGGEIDQHDITIVPTSDIPDHDLLVGGFPCQAFSVAGKRAGFNDTRGTMFFEVARILKDKRPGHLVLENVKGLLSHDRGQTFQTILTILADLGYRVEWQLLNSKDFGVPQNRERVYIVGHLGEGCGRKIFPFGTSNEARIRELNNPRHSFYRAFATDGLAPTVRGASGGTKPINISRVPLRFLKRNQKNIAGDYSYTIDASQTSGVKVDRRIRRLTPVECERLQGFPDDWTAGVSDTQRYRQCGNAVTVNVVEAVITQLLKH